MCRLWAPMFGLYRWALKENKCTVSVQPFGRLGFFGNTMCFLKVNSTVLYKIFLYCCTDNRAVTIHLVLFVNKKSPRSCLNTDFSISRVIVTWTICGITGISGNNCQCRVCFLTSHPWRVFFWALEACWKILAYWSYTRVVLFSWELQDCTLIIPQVGFCLSFLTAGACPLLSEQLANKVERKGNGPSILWKSFH